MYSKNFDLINNKTERFHLIVESMNSSEFSSLNKRDREVYYTNQALANHRPNDTLSYSLNKVPMLSSNFSISISHSRDFLALLIAKHTAAIDIEKVSPKAFKLVSKFLTDKEIELVNNEEAATLLWCAKECLYKIHRKGNIDFRKDLMIHSVQKRTIRCSLFKKKYTLFYEKFNQYFLVYYFD